MSNQDIISLGESAISAPSANLENVNSCAKSAVQTSFTTQSLNGCKVTSHFAAAQDGDIEYAIANMQLSVFQRLHDGEEQS